MIGILNSVIGLYYYLVVLKVVYLYRSEEENKPVSTLPGWKLALVVMRLAAILGIGLVHLSRRGTPCRSSESAGGFVCPDMLGYKII